MKDTFFSRHMPGQAAAAAQDKDHGRVGELQDTIRSIFNALAQLDARASTQSPELLYQQLCTYLQRIEKQGDAAGLARTEVEDLCYALVALSDESALRQGGAFADYWMPRLLQMRFFNENVAGDVFFDRLERMRGRGKPLVLSVYYLCLMFGFRGKFAVAGGELEISDLAEGLRDELARASLLTRETVLSPQGGRPDEPSAQRGHNVLLLAISSIGAITAVLVYFGLRLSLHAEAGQLADRIERIVGG